MGRRRFAGRAVAIAFAAIWIIAILAYSAMRPRLELGKELLKAANTGDAAQVQSLLKRGASVYTRDHDGHTAVWLAAYNGHADALEELLSHGAETDARGQEGWTPLMWAARNGYADCVRELLAHGANINAKGPFGETALQYALSEHHTQIAALLQKAGAAR